MGTKRTKQSKRSKRAKQRAQRAGSSFPHAATSPTDGANALAADDFESSPDSELPSSTSSELPSAPDTDLTSAPESAEAPESVNEVPAVSQVVGAGDHRALDLESDFREFEDFFRSGDDGLYEGGPGDSIAPVTLVDSFEDEVETDPWTSPSVELLARRDRFKRYVTTFVGSLAAGSLLLFGVRGLSAPREDTSLRVAQAAAPVAAAPALVPAARPAAAAPAIEPTIDSIPELTVSAGTDEADAPVAANTGEAPKLTPDVAPAPAKVAAAKAAPARKAVTKAPALRASMSGPARASRVDTRSPAMVEAPGVRSKAPPSAAFPD